VEHLDWQLGNITCRDFGKIISAIHESDKSGNERKKTFLSLLIQMKLSKNKAKRKISIVIEPGSVRVFGSGEMNETIETRKKKKI
jgi:hypothetical protein